ncbi:hypothetical protein [Streptomyces acidiscabies]|uniref:hypothetical protein n=1 Tax=Streptomyces acidiscabies TaxID=42234 RepID=UPI0038F74491
MEYVPGGGLDRQPTVPPARAARIGAQVADALAALTERGPPLVLQPSPGQAQHPGDRGPQVVIAHLAAGDAAQHAESVDVAFEERLLAGGGEHPSLH